MELKIEISSNLKIVNFLDATFDLNCNSYKLFNKTNNIWHTLMLVLTILHP